MFPVGFSDIAPKYFTEGRHRHLVTEVNLLGNLEAGQECLAVRDEFGLIDRTARLKFDGRDNDFAPLRIGSADYGGHFNSGMLVNFDVVWEYILAAASEQVPLGSDYISVYLLVYS